MSPRKCDAQQWCDRACTHACEQAVQQKAEASIANATGQLAGLPHYARHKWGMAESATGEYVRAADVKAVMETEQTMHGAWRKRAEEAETRIAALEAELARVTDRLNAVYEAAYKAIGYMGISNTVERQRRAFEWIDAARKEPTA